MEFADLDLNKLYSYTDYYKWKFDEHVEPIMDHIFKMSLAPTSAYRVISREIAGELWLFLKGNSCQVFSAPFDVRLPSKTDGAILTVVLPDICVVCDPSKIDRKGC